MNELAWYKKRMADPTLDRETYMKYWNIVRDMEHRAAVIYNQGLKRCEETQLKSAQ